MPVDRPNIVWIMADDIGYGDVGCYGATKIQTPNMDRLASQGMRFTDAHASSAVCTPSRYGVVTGRYSWRTRLDWGVLWGHSRPLIEPDRATVGTVLRKQGYATAAVGKWHLGLGWAFKPGARELFPEDLDTYKWSRETGEHIDYTKPFTGGPTALGFDYFFGIAASLDMPPYCFLENDRTVGLPDREKDPYNAQQHTGFMTEGWRDEDVDLTLARKACEWMARQGRAEPERPFFLYLTPSAPHRPCKPPEGFRGISQAGPRGDMVAVVDHMVGRVDDTLHELGVADDTLIVATSDNGARPYDVDGNTYGHKACGDWRGVKADIWDGGHREPFIVRWPGRTPAGSTCEQTVSLTDLMATAVDILGVTLPPEAGPDSLSILPYLLGERPDRPLRETTIHHSMDGMFAVRRGPWKCILGLGSGGFSPPQRAEPEPGGPAGQLYHMDSDPQETTNLWLQRPDIVEELCTFLEHAQAEGRSVPGP